VQCGVTLHPRGYSALSMSTFSVLGDGCISAVTLTVCSNEARYQIVVSNTVTSIRFLLLIYQTYDGHRLRVQIKDIRF
jgi:hypothetical protein